MIRSLKWLPAILCAGLVFAVPAHAKDATKKAPTYDCSKAGNKNKTACKTAAAAPTAPAKTAASAKSAPTAITTGPKAARNYDCSKAGNANKTACKGTASAPVAPLAAPAASKPVAMKPAPAASAPAAKPAMAAGPNGATAQCKDGTYSQSKTHSGSCSHHGGVHTWYK